MRLKYNVLRLIENNAYDHSIVLKSCSLKFIIIKLKNNHIVQDNFMFLWKHEVKHIS